MIIKLATTDDCLELYNNDLKLFKEEKLKYDCEIEKDSALLEVYKLEELINIIQKTGYPIVIEENKNEKEEYDYYVEIYDAYRE